MVNESELKLKPAVWEWTSGTLGLLEKVLKVNIKLFGDPDLLESGEIFLFNHFARFETFIPQYLIYRATGAFSRSVAAPELFREDDRFSQYLLSLGAVPTDQPNLLPFLAAEAIRGRKVIVFPEGGMVKDRRAVDPRGRYAVYSRSARERRKHHTGAAVVALYVAGLKTAVREAAQAGRDQQLAEWAEGLGLDDADTLLRAAERPTRIVPSNISFYPIRIGQNHLHRFADLFTGGLSPRAAEELLIEGNILLRDTDMDIRMGAPLDLQKFLGWVDRRLLRRVARNAASWEQLFGLGTPAGSWAERLWARRSLRTAMQVRDAYMVTTYASLSVNLSHLASRIIFELLDEGVESVPQADFRRTLYLAVKETQRAEAHLHRSLRDPGRYSGLLAGDCPGLDHLIGTAEELELLRRDGDAYHFLPELFHEHDFDEIRLENPLAVYANEVAPLVPVRKAVTTAIRQSEECSAETLATLRFDDELRSHRWDRELFRKEPHREINELETANEDPTPFLLVPRKQRRSVGVVLAHGFTASPAEMRPFGERLADLGFPVVGIRLKGHGTSPWDLLQREWQEWLDSVTRGCEIMAGYCERVCVVGFSTGGTLALRLAAEAGSKLYGVATVAAPLKVRDKSMIFVPMVHGANQLVRTVLPGQGVMLFHEADPEHPTINYRHMPIRALRELRLLMDDAEDHLADVDCPVLVVQGTGDPTVDPRSADWIYDKVGSSRREKVMVDTDRHGILYEDVGETREKIVAFLEELERRPDG